MLKSSQLERNTPQEDIVMAIEKTHFALKGLKRVSSDLFATEPICKQSRVAYGKQALVWATQDISAVSCEKCKARIAKYPNYYKV